MRFPRRLENVLMLALLLAVFAAGSAVLAGCGGDGAGVAERAEVAVTPAPAYPETRSGDVVDDYHGTKVADPYRWLEESEDPEVMAWVDAQNAVTEAYLEAAGNREPIRARLEQLMDYPRYGTPRVRGERLVFTRNTGLQNQAVYFVQDGLDGEPRELLDPNTLREDGTAAVRVIRLSDDGSHMVYGVSWSGSDWMDLYVRNVDTGQDLPDHIEHVKFITPTWAKDGKGFFYTRQPTPGTVPEGEEHYHMKLYYHPLGGAVADDPLLYERPDQKEAGFTPAVTDDGRYLVFMTWVGTAEENEVHYLALETEPWVARPLMPEPTAMHTFVGAVGDRFFFLTDRDAPKRRIVAVDVANPDPSAWTTVVPESDDVISNALIVNGRLAVETMHNAYNRLNFYGLDGAHEAEVEFPAIGAIASMRGEADNPLFFVGYYSFTFPTTIYRYDFDAGKLVEYRRPELDFDRDRYVTRQEWFTSKDGTRVPMFMVHHQDLKQDGKNPTILYGYGGFNVPLTPWFNAMRLYWVEQGGIYVFANLRGGSEFGEEWHRAGMLGNKQNVFDDFIAAAEYLIDEKYTRPERLAIEGASNGGLLTAAVMLQRPELIGVSLVVVPVADMLRYHTFTIARYWTSEYGSSEDPEQFEFLYAYSPLHNVKPGARYPSTLVTTADTDDRVHPGQAKKFAATLQAANASDRPMLIRVETRAGHGGGKPTSKRIDEYADVYGFTLHEMGVAVKP